MKQLPEKLLQSLEGVPGYERGSFIRVHESKEQVTSVRLNPAKAADMKPDFEIEGPVPWSRFGFYLTSRPSFTFDPLFHAGLYYVQEASSMFLEQVFLQLVDNAQPLKVLDLCAAPGGKSTHVQSIISEDSLLVSNEVIRSRCNVLIDNIIKWGSQNVIVTNNDPAAFSNLGEYFDVIVVDAPCSGSGLFRRDEAAIDEWSVNNVQLCCQRQQRILADVLPSLKKNGLLVYSTCSYSREEDEDIMDWVAGEMEMENVGLEIDASWNITTTVSKSTSSTGYRFFPDKVKGEGLFFACFRKINSNGESKLRPSKMEKAPAREKAILQPWMNKTTEEIIKERDVFYALPTSVLAAYPNLKAILNIQYAGTGIGQIMKDKLVPAHSFALSGLVSREVPFRELDFPTAIRYLQKQDITVEVQGKGWQLAGFKGKTLGWINVLPNRINNYYPKELRILKQRNDSLFEK